GRGGPRAPQAIARLLGCRRRSSSLVARRSSCRGRRVTARWGGALRHAGANGGCTPRPESRSEGGRDQLGASGGGRLWRPCLSGHSRIWKESPWSGCRTRPWGL
ncbi:hypothetical protein, partial [Frigoribacterium sp. CFBP 8754]|uniref:hypothetical protein n=1 Tax=Frigoribacterium sp. CFBP 8754 TaxID=2775290 RepID=UPI00352F3BED